MKSKKTLAFACLLFAVVFAVAACASGGARFIGEAKKSQVIADAGLSLVQTGKGEYGEAAYRYLEHIQEALPGRIGGSEMEREAAVFILSALFDMGYEERDMDVQEVSLADVLRAPPGSKYIKNVFDGGELSAESRNIILTKKGKSEKVIVVGAHYDSVATHGVDDNGSGVCVALESAMRMADAEPYYTIRYIFFGAEELGLVGSRQYVASLTQEEREQIVLMVNIDSVLAGDIRYIYGGVVREADEVVLNMKPALWAYEAARALNLDIHTIPDNIPGKPVPVGQMMSDHAPFCAVGIPYIYFEANNWESIIFCETERFGIVMHTDNDDLDILNAAFGSRAQDTLSAYSTLLDYVLLNFTE